MGHSTSTVPAPGKRRTTTAALCTTVFAALALIAHVPGDRAEIRSASAQGPEPSPTAIVRPIITPAPVFMPFLHNLHDPLLPGAIDASARGWVAGLTRRGREACAPATHVLLLEPEGSRGNRAIAVMNAASDDPDLTLDLYIGEFVEVDGTSSLVRPGCEILTWRRISVERIVEREVPPR